MRLLGDAGIGWHIRTGEQILSTHSVPHTDPFSSTMSGRPWFAWEWLFDLVIAAVHRWTGLNGVVFSSAAIIALTLAWVFRLAVKRGAGLPLAVILLMFALGASAIHFLARPHVLSWLLTMLWFVVLDSACNSDGLPPAMRQLLWLPVLMLVWVNLHGGFLIAFVLLGLYLAESVIWYFTAPESATREVAGTRFRRLVVVTLLCLLASLVNPYGYRLHVHIYQYLSDRFLISHIDEFRSPDFHSVAPAFFAALLLITTLAVALTPRKLRPAHLLILLFAISSGLYAARNIPVSSMLLVLITGPLLAQAMAQAAIGPRLTHGTRQFCARLRAFTKRMDRIELRSPLSVWPVLVLLLGTWVSLHQGKLGPIRVMHAHFDQQRFPVAATDYILQHGMRGPVFAPDWWGGYLIYRLYPQTKVVLDDRHDLYGDALLKQYLKLIRVEPGWSGLLDQTHTNWVAVPTDSPLCNMLKGTSAWKSVYTDEVSTLFQRLAAADR